MKLRSAPLALVLALAACSSDRLTGVAAEDAARQYQAQQLAADVEPLFIVDGQEVAAAAARALAPSTIESIEVVKGAAARTAYGERAVAGVVRITTKSPSGGAAR
jgi:TonB-dependent SusC/RagA subfamily outer membrane receptor